MLSKEKEQNTCYTYFCVVGEFNPDDITEKLGLEPDEILKIGDKLRGGVAEAKFA